MNTMSSLSNKEHRRISNSNGVTISKVQGPKYNIAPNVNIHHPNRQTDDASPTPIFTTRASLQTNAEVTEINRKRLRHSDRGISPSSLRMSDTDQTYALPGSRSGNHVRVTRIRSGIKKRRIAGEEKIVSESIVAKENSKRRESLVSQVTVTRLSK
jgi:hypothetical protein